MLSPVSVCQMKSSQLSLPPIGGRTTKAMCKSCKTGRGIEKVAMPFAFRYLTAELAAMNMKLTLKISGD
jgi:DNA-directed RNA polymerase I subunit RPA2